MQVGHEEFYDFIFPEEAGAAPHLKLLELAYRHKKQKMGDVDEEPAADADAGGDDAGADADGEDAAHTGGDASEGDQDEV